MWPFCCDKQAVICLSQYCGLGIPPSREAHRQHCHFFLRTKAGRLDKPKQRLT